MKTKGKRKWIWVFGLMLGAVALVAGPAQATTLEVGGSGSVAGGALQDVLDGFTTNGVTPWDGSIANSPGVSSINVNNDQLSPDELWGQTGIGASLGRLILTFSGGALGGTEVFGVYDAGDSTDLEPLFTTGAVIGDITVFQLSDYGWSNFGFYLTDAGGTTWFSEAGLNADVLDHMVAYNGAPVPNEDTILLPGAGNPGPWDYREYLLAWEDTSGLGIINPGDSDYTDFVVMVESINPVPEPASLALLGLGLVGFGIRRSRRRS